MGVMKFKQEDLKQCIWEDESDDGLLRKVADYDRGSRRWEEDRTLVFSIDGKLYAGYYSIGLTENQDSSWFGYSDEIECVEVESYEVNTTKYREKQ